MMRSSVVCVFLFISILCNAQDTIFNQTDKQGLKQGFWKAKYPNGSIRYTAFFANDKPVGLMKRYFDDNSTMAEMYFVPNSTRVKSKMYFQQGPVAAIGNYSQKDVKDSVWNYYSYYTKTLSRQETYVNGKLDGPVLSYYQSGKLSEDKRWKNGISEGTWIQYYEDGTIKLSTICTNGKRNGQFVSNYPDGKPEWKGNYINDKREGKWENFDPSGVVLTTIEYKDGVATNQAELNAKQQELLQQIEKQQGKIAEPDQNNIMNPAQK
jgi:antitoxin component YwqK of YwqJK toxin-antitoxin module